MSYTGTASPDLPTPVPKDLAKWGLHCFCITARHTPNGVIKADNNGSILWRAQKGVDVESLRSEQINVTESQILLLKAYGLVDFDGHKITTTFPVMGPEIMVPLRNQLHQLADKLAPKILPHARTIAAELTRAGYSRHGYSVVFGYALDGLLWDVLRTRHMLPDTTLDLEHPIWRGAFWAIYPERAGTAGTNETSFDKGALVSVWNDRTLVPLKAHLEVLATLHASGAANSAAGPLPNIPTIRNVSGDPIHDAAADIARLVADELVISDERRKLAAWLPHATQSEALLILAHEFIWDLMDDLQNRGFGKRPDAFDVAHPTPSQLDQLVFLRASE